MSGTISTCHYLPSVETGMRKFYQSSPKEILYYTKTEQQYSNHTGLQTHRRTCCSENIAIILNRYMTCGFPVIMFLHALWNDEMGINLIISRRKTVKEGQNGIGRMVWWVAADNVVLQLSGLKSNTNFFSRNRLKTTCRYRQVIISSCTHRLPRVKTKSKEEAQQPLPLFFLRNYSAGLGYFFFFLSFFLSFFFPFFTSFFLDAFFFSSFFLSFFLAIMVSRKMIFEKNWHYFSKNYSY